MDHQSGIQDDAGEPGPEGGSALETPQVDVPGEKGILDCVFGVFSIAKNGIGRCYELRARRQEHLFESFSPYELRSSCDECLRFVAWRLAGGRPHASFSFLKTGKDLLIAAALACPTKFADLDVYLTGGLRFSLATRSKCLSKAHFAKQSAMRLVFNEKGKLILAVITARIL